MFKPIILAVLLYLTDLFSAPIGGFFYASIARLGLLPIVGFIFRFVLREPLNGGVIVKLVSWFISSSGILLGLGIYYLIWGLPSDTISLVILMLFSITAILHILQKMLLFEVLNYQDILDSPLRRQFSGPTLNGYINDPQTQKFLSRSLFADLYIPQLIKLLISFGIFYYCIGRLEIVELAPKAKMPSLFESISLALSLIPIGFENTKPYAGTVWQYINVFSTLAIFFWTVIFVSLASSMFTEDSKDDKDKSLELNLYKELVDHYSKIVSQPKDGKPE